MSNVQISEADLESYLWKHPSALGVERWIARQFSVPSGIIDLLGVAKHEYTGRDVAIVVELKRGPIDGNAIAQVCRYAADIENAIMIATEDYQPHSVSRMIVGNSCMNSAIFEANAMNVHIRFFEASLEFKITGDIQFTQDFKAEIKSTLKRVGANEALINLYTGIDNDG